MRSLPLAFVLLLPSIALADVSLTYPQQAQCKSSMSLIQISGSRMRVDSAMEDKKYSMLFDGMEDLITALDHDRHSYHQIEVDEDALDYNQDVMSSTGNYIGNQMNALQAQMKEQCAQMQKQGMSCPNIADISAMMQTAQAMSGLGSPVIEIKPGNKNQTIAGMPCNTIDRYQNGRKSSEECYVEPKDFSMSEKDKKYLLRNLKVMVQYSSTFSGLAEKFKMAAPDKPVQPDPANKDILLSQVCFAPDGSEAGRIEVQISNAAIDETSFDIPPGYQVMKMSEQ